MDIKRYIITEVHSDHALVKGRDWMGFTYDWQDSLRLEFDRVRAVRYDLHGKTFKFLKTVPSELANRQPQAGDVIMANISANGQIRLWTYIEHYDAVDAAQPRCCHEGCKTIVEDKDDLFCRWHDPDYQEEYCDGCDQPEACCTCAEIESLRRHNANPATRGSYWVA